MDQPNKFWVANVTFEYYRIENYNIRFFIEFDFLLSLYYKILRHRISEKEMLREQPSIAHQRDRSETTRKRLI